MVLQSRAQMSLWVAVQSDNLADCAPKGRVTSLVLSLQRRDRVLRGILTQRHRTQTLNQRDEVRVSPAKSQNLIPKSSQRLLTTQMADHVVVIGPVEIRKHHLASENCANLASHNVAFERMIRRSMPSLMELDAQKEPGLCCSEV